MNKKKMQSCYLLLALMVLCQPVFGAEIFKLPYSEKIDVTKKDQVFEVDGFAVTVSMSRPAKAFKKISFSFRFEKEGIPFSPSMAMVRFNMKMDMGDYHAELKPDGKTFTAKNIMLPKCMSGGKRWYGKLYFSAAGKEHSLVFILDLQ